MDKPLTQLRIPMGDDTGADDSLLGYLMRLAEASGPLLISFEDLVGMTLDHPELRLPDEMRMHKGPLCLWAKELLRTERGLLVCSTNKYMANRKVLHLSDTLIGQCHLGLTDICQPLIYRQQVMGIFYYGSVVLAEHQQRLRERLIAECRRQRLDMEQALTALEQVPVLRSQDLPIYEARLRKLCQIVATMLNGLGFPADCYRSYNRAKEARVGFGGTPRLVVRAVRLINTYLDHPLTLASIAKRLQCQPRYLGRVFHRSMGVSVADFLLRTRVERACNLLKMGRVDVTRVAYEVGFTDKSNFSRSFRKIMGVPPGEYRKRFKVDDTAECADGSKGVSK